MSDMESTIYSSIRESMNNCHQLQQTIQALYESYPDYPILKTLFYKLTHLNLNEDEAQNLFHSILKHCINLEEQMEDPCNFYVGMLDYIIERNRIIMNPIFVDLYLSPHSPADLYKDALTLTFNQNYLSKALNAEIGRSQRKERIFSVMMLDIDKFSQINNNHGYNIGNQILVEIVTRIQKTIRAEDTLIRYYDDRFILIMPSTDIEGAETLTERILSTLLKDVIQLERKIFNVSFSIGVVCYPVHGETEEQIIEQLTLMRYKSKEHGGNFIASPSSPQP